jgi:hypothetical protein
MSTRTPWPAIMTAQAEFTAQKQFCDRRREEVTGRPVSGG